MEEVGHGQHLDRLFGVVVVVVRVDAQAVVDADGALSVLRRCVSRRRVHYYGHVVCRVETYLGVSINFTNLSVDLLFWACRVSFSRSALESPVVVLNHAEVVPHRVALVARDFHLEQLEKLVCRLHMRHSLWSQGWPFLTVLHMSFSALLLSAILWRFDLVARMLAVVNESIIVFYSIV